MNMKKITAAFAAAAMAVTMSAASAMAATVTMNDSYTGSWSASACIPKSELTAIGGDVKITLTLETRNLANTADQFLIRPMDYDNGWLDQSPYCTSDSVVMKTDGMFCIPENSTTCEFVLAGDAVANLGESGLSFQVQNVIIKSADLEAGTAQGAIRTLGDAEGKEYCFGKSYEEIMGIEAETEAPAEEAAAEETEAPAEEAAVEETEAPAEEAAVEETEAPAEEAVEETEAPVEEVAVETEAPVADAPVATTPAATGNAAASAIAVVMVAAGAVAVASKRK